VLKVAAPPLVAGVMLVTVLAGCGSARAPVASPSATGGTTVAPRVVNATSTGGSAGIGPLVISHPTPVPGGPAGSEQVVLPDRTLIVNTVTSQPATSAGSVLIDLDLSVRNNSGSTVKNEPTFFQLLGPGGDTFGHQDNSSDTFYGAIPAHTSRRGTIELAVPRAAASGLNLLYRPEIAKETVIVALTP
jgi:hypothetical protein